MVVTGCAGQENGVLGGAPRPSQASSGDRDVNLLTIGTLALAGAMAAMVGIAISKTRH